MISGVGYRVAKDGQDAVLHRRLLAPGAGHAAGRASPSPSKATTASMWMASTSNWSAKRPPRCAAIREPEPYLGKGIAYDGERIRRKQGKTGAKGKGKK